MVFLALSLLFAYLTLAPTWGANLAVCITWGAEEVVYHEKSDEVAIRDFMGMDWDHWHPDYFRRQGGKPTLLEHRTDGYAILSMQTVETLLAWEGGLPPRGSSAYQEKYFGIDRSIREATDDDLDDDVRIFLINDFWAARHLAEEHHPGQQVTAAMIHDELEKMTPRTVAKPMVAWDRSGHPVEGIPGAPEAPPMLSLRTIRVLHEWDAGLPEKGSPDYMKKYREIDDKIATATGIPLSDGMRIFLTNIFWKARALAVHEYGANPTPEQIYEEARKVRYDH